MSYCRVCGDESFFKVGWDQVPLCVPHFQEWLRERAEVVGGGDRNRVRPTEELEPAGEIL